MKTKQALVPKLRFGAFQDKWTDTRLESLAKTVTSGSRDWAQYYSDEGSKFIRMTNLPRGGIQLLLGDLRYVKLPKTSSEGKRTSLEAYDILISITAELGKIGLIPSDFGTAYINQHTALVRLDLHRSDAHFIAYKLSSKRMNNIINRLNDSGAKSGLNLPTIRSFPLSLPTLPEQEKIAGFLTSVDDRIDQLKRKKSLLQDYKKGVMQKLFSQELRFKDDNGKPYPDWEEKKLGEVCDVIMGQSPDSRSYNEIGNGLPLIQGNADIKKRKSCPRIWTSEPTKVCVDGDLLLTVRAPVGAVAKSEHHACLGRGVASIKSKPTATQGFIYQWLLEFEPRWIRLEQGSTFTAVSGADIRGLAINVPSVPEQTKIANFLSTLDQKIEQIDTQITQTQTFKKGLLQQMFV